VLLSKVFYALYITNFIDLFKSKFLHVFLPHLKENRRQSYVVNRWDSCIYKYIYGCICRRRKLYIQLRWIYMYIYGYICIYMCFCLIWRKIEDRVMLLIGEIRVYINTYMDVYVDVESYIYSWDGYICIYMCFCLIWRKIEDRVMLLIGKICGFKYIYIHTCICRCRKLYIQQKWMYIHLYIYIYTYIYMYFCLICKKIEDRVML
jgi:hypothetical protein